MLFKRFLGGTLICCAAAASATSAASGNGTVTLSIKLRESLSRSGENNAEDVRNITARASQFNLSLEPFIIPPSSSEPRVDSLTYAVDPIEEYKQQLLFGLGRFYQTTVDVNVLEDVLRTFESMPEVESVQAVPEIALWEGETVNTDFFANSRAADGWFRSQTYLQGPIPAPQSKYKVGGINAMKLHEQYPKVKGKNARIISVENDHWLYSHEDLPEPWIKHWTPQELGSHDTQSAGIMFAKDNGIGVVGIATGAAAGYSRIGTTGQLLDLAKYLKAGDVLQMGVQASVRVPGSDRNDLTPIEYHEAVRMAIQYLVEKKGVHVIYAAGNGYINADKYVPRSKDSGAISVGALNPLTGARHDFSNWGERVDVFSWGSYVATTYADEKEPEVDNLYTLYFRGTSAANPIIAGAVGLLQSIAFDIGIGPVPPKLMREALVNTGVPLLQQDPGQHQVQPDLVKALEYIIREASPAQVGCNGWVGSQSFPNDAECDKVCNCLCSDKKDVLACMQALVFGNCVYPVGNSTTTTSTRSTTTTTTTTSKGGLGGKDCIGIEPWSATKVYSTYNEEVVHDGKKYKQNFYSINAPPANNNAQYGKPWILVGSC